MEFRPFPKMARLYRDIIVTEKLDGTNASIAITPDGEIFVGSRTRWITPEEDNHGFARWAYEHKEELLQLGPGHHFGEWWGSGINRGYDLPKGEKRFSLFNVSRWRDNPDKPACCYVVPVLYEGPFDMHNVRAVESDLRLHGSVAAPGFRDPEGIVVFHTAGNVAFKRTLKNDDKPKGKVDV
jgi:hypothetical protein